jgi:hypothetical protein
MHDSLELSKKKLKKDPKKHDTLKMFAHPGNCLEP